MSPIAHLLPNMLPASWRGLTFFAPDVRTESGRRVAEHLFPGHDRAAYDDHGILPPIVTLEGLMVGDDYVLQARLMQAAFERPGPGTLVHPWMGPMTAIMVQPGEVSFQANELRVARLYASFTRVGPAGGIAAIVATATRVSSAAGAVADAALRLAGAVR